MARLGATILVAFFVTIQVLSKPQYPICLESFTFCVNISESCHPSECVSSTVSGALKLIPDDVGGYRIFLVSKNSGILYENIVITTIGPNISRSNEILPYPHHEVTILPLDPLLPVLNVEGRWWKVHEGWGKLTFRSPFEASLPNFHAIIIVDEIADGGIFLGPFSVVADKYVSGTLIGIRMILGLTSEAMVVDGVIFSSINDGLYHKVIEIQDSSSVTSPLSNSTILGSHKRFWIKNCKFIHCIRKLHDSSAVYVRNDVWYGTIESNYFYEDGHSVAGWIYLYSMYPIEVRIWNNVFETYFKLDSTFRSAIVTLYTKNDYIGTLNVLNNLLITNGTYFQYTVVESSDFYTNPPKTHTSYVYNNLMMSPDCFFTVAAASERVYCHGSFGYNRQLKVTGCDPPSGWANNNCLLNYIDGGNNTRGPIDHKGTVVDPHLSKPFPYYKLHNDLPGHPTIGPPHDFLGRPKKAGHPSLGPFESICPYDLCNYPLGVCTAYDEPSNTSTCSCTKDIDGEYISEGPLCECDRRSGLRFGGSSACECDPSRNWMLDPSGSSCICNSTFHLEFDLDYSCVCEDGWIQTAPLTCSCDTANHFVLVDGECVCDPTSHFVMGLYEACVCDSQNYFVANDTNSEQCICRTDLNFIFNETLGQCSCGYEYEVANGGTMCMCSASRGYKSVYLDQELFGNTTTCVCEEDLFWSTSIGSNGETICSCDPALSLMEDGMGGCGCSGLPNSHFVEVRWTVSELVFLGKNNTNATMVDKPRLRCECEEGYELDRSVGGIGDCVEIEVKQVIIWMYLVGSGGLLMLCLCCCCVLYFLCICGIPCSFCCSVNFWNCVNPTLMCICGDGLWSFIGLEIGKDKLEGLEGLLAHPPDDLASIGKKFEVDEKTRAKMDEKERKKLEKQEARKHSLAEKEEQAKLKSERESKMKTIDRLEKEKKKAQKEREANLKKMRKDQEKRLQQLERERERQEKQKQKEREQTIKEINRKKELLSDPQYLDKVGVSDLIDFVMGDNQLENPFKEGKEVEVVHQPSDYIDEVMTQHVHVNDVEEKEEEEEDESWKDIYDDEEDRKLHQEIEVDIPVDPIRQRPSAKMIEAERKRKQKEEEERKMIKIKALKNQAYLTEVLRDFAHLPEQGTPNAGNSDSDNPTAYIDDIMAQFDLTDVTDQYHTKK